MTDTYSLRSPNTVMRLSQLGAFHQTRLSFVRSLIRKLVREQWEIACSRWDIDDDGYGTAVYQVVATAGEQYSLVFFSDYLPPDKRTDRVIATQWDVAFVLCAGFVTNEQVNYLRQHVPKQEIGRYLPWVLVLSRANKSTRNFEAVLGRLSQGEQPNPAQLADVGYLYRTTAVYGNGKFGLADFARLEQTQAFNVSFRAQMFAVFMLREFAIRQINYLAKLRNPEAATLDLTIARYLGTGNATGLGMAPFIVSHPQLLHQWIETRELAIARTLADGELTDVTWQRFQQLVARAAQHVREVPTVHELQQQRYAAMLTDLSTIAAWSAETNTAAVSTWTEALAQIETLCPSMHSETVEALHSILLELYPDIVNPLGERMNVHEAMQLQPDMRVGDLCHLLTNNYAWALDIDFAERENQQWFWYSSAEKEEPRLGNRYEEPGMEKERPLDIGRQIRSLYATLGAFSAEQRVIDVLLQHPTQRGIIQRVQSLAGQPYAEIRDNLIGVDCLPIDMLRCKLSFFGASKFDPRSNLWVRITLFQGAPLLDDIRQESAETFADDWFWPTMPVAV